MTDFREKYGKNVGIYASPYDKRDWKLDQLIPKGSIKIPVKFESPRTPFVYDQGESSQCAACSYNLIRYMQESDTDEGGSGIDSKFSTSFTYANRPDGEDFEGMYLRSVCKMGREGSLPWDVFPGFFSYNKCKMIFLKNKDKWLEIAAPFKITSFYQCTSREQVQQAIMETKAVLAGIYVLDCIYTVDRDGIVYYDKNRDIRSYGGHAITLVGWDSNFKESGEFYWIAQNSWGENYGDNGRFYIPEAFPWLENPYAVIDSEMETKWSEYKTKYNL